MSNQPKITYRSDTTGCTYQMMQHTSTFTIQAVDNMADVVVESSPQYAYRRPWRSTIDMFFDVCTVHINTGRWT